MAPDAAGQGFGRALLGQVIARCTALGFRQMVAVIGDSGNGASIRLHESLGFRRAGRVNIVNVKRGDVVKAGDVLLVLEAMKMQVNVTAPENKVIAEVAVEKGDTVDAGDLLVVFE